MSTIIPVTLQELRDCWMEEGGEDIELVDVYARPDDHGYGFTYVFQRHSDNTYWQTSGVCQNGGDYHQLRSLESSTPLRVYRHKREVITYSKDP